MARNQICHVVDRVLPGEVLFMRLVDSVIEKGTLQGCNEPFLTIGVSLVNLYPGDHVIRSNSDVFSKDGKPIAVMPKQADYTYYVNSEPRDEMPRKFPSVTVPTSMYNGLTVWRISDGKQFTVCNDARTGKLLLRDDLNRIYGMTKQSEYTTDPYYISGDSTGVAR